MPALSIDDFRPKHSSTPICHGGLVPDRGDKGMRYVYPRIAAIGMLSLDLSLGRPSSLFYQ
jgi:hypothetical protein